MDGQTIAAHVELEWFTLPPSWSMYNPCIAGRAIALHGNPAMGLAR
jgi:hypothetical protein